jgi:hypothetical protein
MTISSAQSAITWPGTGAQSVFTFPFVWGAANWISVTYTDSDGVDWPLTPSEYTFTGNPAGPNALWGVGGTVTYLRNASPIPVGSTLTIRRTLPVTQLYSFLAQQGFNPANIERALDQLCMILQQVERDFIRDAGGERITNVGAPVSPTDAATAGWVEAFVAGLVEGGGTIYPSQWEFTGNGTQTVFLIPTTESLGPTSTYFVTLDGVAQTPGTDFTVLIDQQTITFDAAPPNGSKIVVRCFGFARAIGVPPAGSVTNTKLADMPEGTIKGRLPGAGSGVPIDATMLQARDALSLFESAASAAGKTVPAGLLWFSTAGYAAPGDGGGAIYNVVGSEPSHAGKIALAGGKWGELAYDGVANVRAFGAKGDFTANDLPAFQAAHAYLKVQSSVYSRAGKIYAPRGYYLFSGGGLVIDGDLISLAGDGARSTHIVANSDIGDIVQFTSADPTTTSHNGGGVRDLTIRQYADVSSGAGLRLTRCTTFFADNVFIRNCFGGLLTEGGIGHFFNNVSIETDGVWSAYKAGSYLAKWTDNNSAQQKLPAEMFYSNLNARAGSQNKYLDYGFIIEAADGLWWSNTHVFGCATADMHIKPRTGNMQITGLHCGNVWFDNFSGAGVIIEGSTTAAFGAFEFSGCRSLGHDNDGFWIKSGCNVSTVAWIGGNVIGSQAAGFLIQGGKHVSIVGAVINQNGKNTGATWRAGIGISGAPENITISGNVIGGTGLTGASETQVRGVFIGGGTPEFVTIVGNTFRNNISHAIDDNTTTTTKVIGKNTYAASIFQSVGASGTTLQIPTDGEYFELTTGTGNVEDLRHKYQQRIVTLYINSTRTFVHNASVMQLAGSANFSAKAGDTLTLVSNGSLWREIGRKVS